MKKLGSKITYEQTAERLLINVSGRGTAQQVLILMLWLGVWTISGIIVLSQLFGNYTGEEKIALSVWLGFWLYFEYRVYYIYRWRKGGLEILKVEGGKLSYSREVNGLGKVHVYDAQQVRNLKVIDYSDSPFQRSFYKSWFSVGGEMLSFSVNSTEHRVAMQIEESEAKQLAKMLDKELAKSD